MALSPPFFPPSAIFVLCHCCSSIPSSDILPSTAQSKSKSNQIKSNQMERVVIPQVRNLAPNLHEIASAAPGPAPPPLSHPLATSPAPTIRLLTFPRFSQCQVICAVFRQVRLSLSTLMYITNCKIQPMRACIRLFDMYMLDRCLHTYSCTPCCSEVQPDVCLNGIGAPFRKYVRRCGTRRGGALIPSTESI